MSRIRDDKYLSEIQKDFKLRDGDFTEGEVLPLINIVRNVQKETRVFSGQCTGVSVTLFTVPSEGCYLKGVFINNICIGNTGNIGGAVSFTDAYGNGQAINLTDYAAQNGSSDQIVNTGSFVYVPFQKVRLQPNSTIVISNSGSNYTNALIEVELI